MTIDPAAHGDPASAPVQWQGRFIATHTTPAGWEFVTRTSGPNAVVICALDPIGRVVLVEQYRVPLGKNVIEFPAGLVGDDADAAHGAGDDVLATAQRELIEECGFSADRLELLCEGPVSAGLTDETLFLVRASGLTRVSEGGGVAGDEAITVHLIEPDELNAFLIAKRQAGVLVDIKINLGLQALALPPVWLNQAEA